MKSRVHSSNPVIGGIGDIKVATRVKGKSFHLTELSGSDRAAVTYFPAVGIARVCIDYAVGYRYFANAAVRIIQADISNIDISCRVEGKRPRVSQRCTCCRATIARKRLGAVASNQGNDACRESYLANAIIAVVSDIKVGARGGETYRIVEQRRSCLTSIASIPSSTGAGIPANDAGRLGDFSNDIVI